MHIRTTRLVRTKPFFNLCYDQSFHFPSQWYSAVSNVTVPVSAVSHMFHDIAMCAFSMNINDSVESVLIHDTNLTDGDLLSCVELANASAMSITVRLSRKHGPFAMPTEILVSGHDLNCSPEGGLTVFASALCRAAPCGVLSVCTRLHTLLGTACKFQCCEKYQACETFFLHLTHKAQHEAKLCDVTITF